MDFSWGNYPLWASISKPLEPTIAMYRNTKSRWYYLIYRSNYYSEFSLPFPLSSRINDFRPEPDSYFIIYSDPPNQTFSIVSKNTISQDFIFRRIQ